MSDMDDSLPPLPNSNASTNHTTLAMTSASSSTSASSTSTCSSSSTSISISTPPSTLTSLPTMSLNPTSFTFGSSSSSHSQRPHLTSPAFPLSPAAHVITTTPISTHKRTSQAANVNGVHDHDDDDDDDEEDEDRGNASKRKYKRMESDRDEDYEDEKQTSTSSSFMNDATVDDSFFDLLTIFSKLNFPDAPPEQCPLCPASFPIKEFAAHVYTCIKQLDQVDREQQEKADERLAYKIATENGAEEDQFFYARRSDDLDMTSSGIRRKCPKGARCDRKDARHFIDIEHPPVSCPICEQPFPVYELDAHITFCLTQPQQPKPAFNQPSTASSSFSTLSGGDTNMDGNNNNNNNNNTAFNSSAFSAIRDDLPAPSPSPPLPGKIVFGEDLPEDDDDGRDAPRRSASVGANATRPTAAYQLTLERAAAMASLVVDQQSKSLKNQQYSLGDLLDTFKTLGFTQENLSNLSKTIDPSKQLPSAASPQPAISASQPTESSTSTSHT